MYQFISLAKRHSIYSDVKTLAQHLVGKMNEIPSIQNPSQFSLFLSDFVYQRECISEQWVQLSQAQSLYYDKALDAIHQEVLQQLVALDIDMLTNPIFLDHLKKHLQHLEHQSNLQENLSLIDHELIDYLNYLLKIARQMGSELSLRDQKELKALLLELSDLSVKYDCEMFALIETSSLIFTQDDLSGLTTDQLSFFEKNEQGDYLVNLSSIASQFILEFAEKRQTREKFFRSFIARGGKVCSETLLLTQITTSILSIRSQIAKLLGFSSFRQFVLSERFAKNEEEISSLYQKLLPLVKKSAVNCLEKLSYYARSLDIEEIQPWDLAFTIQKSLAQKGYSQEKWRPFFQIEKCIQIFSKDALICRGLKIIPAQHSASDWSPFLKTYLLYDAGDVLLGEIHCDFYARKNKSEGAWMQQLKSRAHLPHWEQHPVVLLVMNFSEPYLLLDEVVTLYHEMGHAIHHIMSRRSMPPLSSIEHVPWDIVELPSQLAEKSIFSEDFLKNFTNENTHQFFTENEIQLILMADKDYASLFLLRQLLLGLYDWNLHGNSIEGSPRDLWLSLQKKWNLFAVMENDYRWADFSHIFSGGYAAGYYGYIYADIFVHQVGTKIKTQDHHIDFFADFCEAFLSRGSDPSLRNHFDRFLKEEMNIKSFCDYYKLED